MSKGYFITFEGGEGTGKSTLMASLKARLEAASYSVTPTREPGGGGKMAEAIRALLLSQDGGPLPGEAELFLYSAARVLHCTQVLRPALAKGEVVLCDRFSDATEAYQGYGRGLDLEKIRHLNAWATQGLVPDCTFLLDCPPEEGLSRAKRRLCDTGMERAEGRFEAEALAFHQRVREGYFAILRREPQRVVLLETTPSPKEVLHTAWTILEARLRGRPS